MPEDSEFLPPVQYLPWWGILGVLLLALVIAWYFFVFFSTRASQVPQQRPVEIVPPTDDIRARYLGLIDQARLAHANGFVSAREAHHKLSLIVRSFVSEREGKSTGHLTLRDLRATPFTSLSDTVEKLYPGEFAHDHRGTVAQAADEAIRLVTTWR
ncbi:MAG: hypothetical protein ACRCSP_01100 [Rhodoglobus sp.]